MSAAAAPAEPTAAAAASPSTPGEAALAARVAELEAALAAERVQRAAERAARIRLQRLARTTRLDGNGGSGDSSAAPEAATLSARAIGTLHSCFSRRNGTPRQPALVGAARSALQLRRGVPGDALSGLEGFSHAWVVYVFHANTNLHVPDARFKARVAVPRLDGGTRGVFATRTPHRPVPLGLSLGRILSVDARRGVVTFQGLDLVDGTPVLDIKPYVRALTRVCVWHLSFACCVRRPHAHPPHACRCWLAAAHTTGAPASAQVPFCDAPPAGEAFAPDWCALHAHTHACDRRLPDALSLSQTSSGWRLWRAATSRRSRCASPPSACRPQRRQRSQRHTRRRRLRAARRTPPPRPRAAHPATRRTRRRRRRCTPRRRSSHSSSRRHARRFDTHTPSWHHHHCNH
jgi:tRNA-Thr(GGU) m(6)t(6)A37 methyltransferase TsaA